MIRLSDFATAPLYNIKAVVQATQISPSTLRAWERRYEFCTPRRSKSGYRLYSDQDIAIIRWLKYQVESGMAISQAVSWYQTLLTDVGSVGHVILPSPNRTQSSSFAVALSNRTAQSDVRSFEVLQYELVNALTSFQDEEADLILTEAFGYYSIEEIGERLITPVLTEVGIRWHGGQLNIAREHYATNYIRQHILSVLCSSRQNHSGHTIWVGCAPEEHHEIGAILLSIYLKRAGFQVQYLGQNLPVDEFSQDIENECPAMVIFSASTIVSAQQLGLLTKKIATLNLPRVIVGYGGQIFNKNPELRQTIAGVYLGETGAQAVEMALELVGSGIPVS